MAKAAVTAMTRMFQRLLGAHGMAPAVPDARDPVWAWFAGCVATRKAGEAPRVETLLPADSPHAWLLVVADDQPFLTDTSTLAVRKYSSDIPGLWHPVVAVERVRGHLESASVAKGGSRKPQEAWILFQLPRMDKAAAKALADDVKQGLALAVAAVRDFAPMQAKLNALHEGFARGEERAFLQWLLDGHMILLGYRHYDYSGTRGALTVQATAGSGLGIMAERTSSVREAKPVAHVGSLGLHVQGKARLVLSKTPEVSRVHRSGSMDYLAILERNAQGRVVGEHRFIGLYTSSAYTAAVHDIPLVREKIEAVVKGVNWPREGHNARSLLNVLEMWPRDELFLTDVDTLSRLAVATVANHERPDVMVLARASRPEQAAGMLVYLPLERMSTGLRERIGLLLAEKLGSEVREFKVELGDGGVARLFFRLTWDGKTAPDEVALTHAVRALVRGWDDELRDALVAALGAAAGVQAWREFCPLAGAGYKAATPVAVALDDAALVRAGVAEHVRLVESPAGLHIRLLRRGQAWLLAELMPLVNSCGLAAVNEQTFPLGDVWVHDVLCVKPDGLDARGQAALTAVLDACLRGVLEEDSLNRLAASAGLGVREISVWRAWVAYMQQIDRRLDARTVRHTVRARPDLARLLWDAFCAQHDPAVSERQRASRGKALLAQAEQLAGAMPTAEQERVWRTAVGLVGAILRTNVWQGDLLAQGEAWAFKLESGKIPGLAEPKPWREIFVYHPTVEGVHLRGGRVARGGLRHSDRATDYRTEVLGLMTAQMRKNTIIVPVGAKGGFYVRAALPAERAAAAAMVKGCYQRYIRALLSVTDTYAADGRVVAPRNVVRHDGDDPYLVVAADKGTAKFSDTANGEALAAHYWPGVEGGFWLGDAFASGGSKGYDHKAMGITAKGAWVSVAHHLAALQLTPSAARPVTLAGIGDMAGDVFGNGLLRDRHVKLVAAFNHLHIFLDPEPDPAVSFAERQRMFDAALGWDGYDVKKISKGGGVYLRASKSIALSPQVQARLGVKAREMTPDGLISAILKAPVDALWNGGIGTYIKASDEPHSAASDKANDEVRVDADEVRAKVIGEGGNLGITPRGRVELARRGILLNTDALDNSAGVDTSDHEVNVKILLQMVMRDGKMTEAARVDLLRTMTDEISALVLRDNAQQNLVVTLDSAEDEAYHHELHRWQDELVRHGVVDPVIDCLPGARDLAARKPALYTRPELCALLAGTKAWLRAELVRDTKLLGNEALQPLLEGYFPTALQAKFGGLIAWHPLAHEITATVLVNMLVNRLGILAIPRLMGDFDASASDAVRALTVAITAPGMGQLWSEMDAKPELPHATVVAVSQRLKLVSGVLAAWVLRHGQPVDVDGWLQQLQEPLREILAVLPKALSGRPEMAKWADEWAAMGLPAALAKRLSLLSPLVIGPDVAMMAAAMRKPLVDVLALHLRMGEVLKLPALVRKVRAMHVPDAWTRQAVQAMGMELFTRQRRLTEHLLRGRMDVDAWLGTCDGGCQRYYALVRDILHEKQLSVAMLSVLLGRLRELES